MIYIIILVHSYLTIIPYNNFRMLSNSVSHNNTLHIQNVDLIGEIQNLASIPVYVKSPRLQSGMWVKRVSSPMIDGNNNYWQKFITAGLMPKTMYMY